MNVGWDFSLGESEVRPHMPNQEDQENFLNILIFRSLKPESLLAASFTRLSAIMFVLGSLDEDVNTF